MATMPIEQVGHRAGDLYNVKVSYKGLWGTTCVFVVDGHVLEIDLTQCGAQTQQNVLICIGHVLQGAIRNILQDANILKKDAKIDTLRRTLDLW